MPPLQALVALHGMWLLLLAPAAVAAASRLRPATLRRAGSLILLAATLGLAVVAAREAALWLPSVPPEWRRYYPQRVLFSLAVMTDWPLVQLAVLGCVCRLAARRRAAGEQVLPSAQQLPAPQQPPTV